MSEVKDSYALHSVDAIIESISVNKFQVELSDDHKERTAFTVGQFFS